MKRKRGTGKRKPKKPAVAGPTEVPVDPGYYSDTNQEKDELGSRTEIETREVNTNVSGEHVSLDKPVINNKTVGGGAANLAWAISSSRTNRVPMQRERIGEKEPKTSNRGPTYNKQDLDAAQSVIKSIMEMDAAVPFNTPVDPIALGIPDYFDIIDTPMDFGTIFSKLENGLKYRNSEEVFKDVQLVWDNCFKYNKKGSYIVELMKRLKNNFMKQWTAAGLYKEQQTVSNGHLDHNPQILAEPTTRHEEAAHIYPAGSTMRREEAAHISPPGSTMRRKEAADIYPSGSTMRHEEAAHMYPPVSTMRHEEAAPMYSPGSTMRRRETADIYPSGSTMRHEEAAHMYTPRSTMRREEAAHMDPPGSPIRRRETADMYPSGSTMRYEEATHMYPPGSTMRRKEAADIYPSRSTMRHEEDAHIYPSRSTMRHDEAADMYPPRSTMRHEEDAHIYHSRSTMRHEEDAHIYPPRSTMRHEEAADMYPPRSTMRREETAHRYPPVSTMRHEESGHMYPPGSTMRREEATHMYPPGSSMMHEEPGHMHPVGSTISKSAYAEQHDWNQKQHQQLSNYGSHIFKPQQIACCSHTQNDMSPQHNHFTHLHSGDHMNGKPGSQWVNEAGPSRVHSSRPSPSCSFMGPPKQRSVMHQSSSSHLPPSQIQAGNNAHGAGHLHLPHREHAVNSGRDVDDGYHRMQYQAEPVRVQSYHPSVSRMPVHEPNQSAFHQVQSSHIDGGRNDDYAGNRHVPHPTESTANFTTRGTEHPRPLVTDKTSCQNLNQANLTPEQSSSSMANIEACLPLEKTCQNQPESSSPERIDTNFSKRKTRSPGLVQCQEQLSPLMNDQEHQPHEETGQIEIVTPQSRPSPPTADYSNKKPKRKYRVRGPTRDLEFEDGERIPIITNSQGQPVGPNAQKLVTYLGTLARIGEYLPLTYLDWRYVPFETKERMWEIIQLRFDIDPAIKDWVMRSLSIRWKDWKSKLKMAHYNPHNTDEERLADRDRRVLPDQWAALIKIWSSDAKQRQSARNKINRMKQKYIHATGRKTFAQLREEQKANRPDGKEPSRAELFVLTRTRKNGEPTNEAASEIITKIRDREKDQDTPENNNKKDVLSEIIGKDKKGRTRCVLLGPSPDDLGGKSSRIEAIKMAYEANSEIREMKGKMAAMEQTCAQMASQMAAMMSMMSSMHKNEPDNEDVHDNMAVVNSSGASDHSVPQPPHSKQTPGEGSKRQTRQSKSKI